MRERVFRVYEVTLSEHTKAGVSPWAGLGGLRGASRDIHVVVAESLAELLAAIAADLRRTGATRVVWSYSRDNHVTGESAADVVARHGLVLPS